MAKTHEAKMPRPEASGSLDISKMHAIYGKFAQVYLGRWTEAVQNYSAALAKASSDCGDAARPRSPVETWRDITTYWADFGQRSLLFWDTLRQRGNNWLAHEKAGKPPLLAFDYEIIADARKNERPVNYALARIIPTSGISIDPDKRPFVIIDPRAGHGPGIGGFKEDSQVGVAMKAGHQVYFVIFFPEPMPGQTLADVAKAEADFLRIVREHHPTRGKPVIIGNCQGGWAAMLVGAIDPDGAGPIVVNGATMSYWAGNDAENPMRYAGGILGGTWPALLASDLGGGIFDGAYLVDNFEYLNPANTFFQKYYNLYSKIDSEPERFLEFERWWGGFFLMNREEIKWIVENLFVGNRLAAGDVEWSGGKAVDLRGIRSPIILFASLGDNITPPQQAFNWIADLYPTTEALKANGQVIVGLMHGSVGHLGIFVSGAVAKKEHSQIVELLEYIEHLPPGLYGMQIEEQRSNGAARYEVTLTERRVEELRLLQKYDRRDEIPFNAVAKLSELNASLYESFVHPMLAASISPEMGRIARLFHPLRMQRWLVSDLNPWLAPLAGLASMVKASRMARDETGRSVAAEHVAAATVNATLDFYRHLRDAAVENLFFNVYAAGSRLVLHDAEQAPALAAVDKDTPAIRNALARIEVGGFTEAAVRAGLLVGRLGKHRRDLSTLKRIRELVGHDVGLLDMPADAARALIRDQSLIVDYEPETALQTLPKLLRSAEERQRVLKLLDRLADNIEVTPQQQDFVAKLRKLLSPRLESIGSAGTFPRAIRAGPKVARSQ
jgi:pimeloyl-ACP methyl ester carboxylesterase